MEINLELKAEEINRAVAQVISESILGKEIIKLVEERVKQLTKDYNDPLKRIIEEHTKKIVIDVIETEYRQILRKHVIEMMAGDRSEAVVKTMVERFQKGYI